MLFMLILGALLFTIEAHAEGWVDSGLGSLDHKRGAYIPRDGYGYQRPDGTIDYPPVIQKHEDPFPAHRSPSVPPQHTLRTYEEPYNVLTEKVPGRDYRSGNILHDRVR